MADLKDLALRMQRLANGPNSLSERANGLKIYAATQIAVDLIQKTPVDTSKALSNWQVGLGEKPTGSLPPYVLGKAASSEGASIEAAISVALSILREARPGQSIWITNNLPYIRRLNDGSSAQAPAGFVERAELIGRKIIQTTKL